MRRILLVPWGRTDWDAQERLTGDTDIPISDEGRAQTLAVATELAPLQPVAVFSGPEEAARQTAELIADSLGLKSKVRDALHEWNLGTWEGLTETEFSERFPKVHRQWHDEPSTVCPPEGETLSDVAARLQEDFRKLIRRAKAGPIVIVMGRLAAAALALLLRGESLEQLWRLVDEPERWRCVEHPRPSKDRPAGPPV